MPEMAPVRARFVAIVILDGSRLAASAHRLKLLWNERAVVLLWHGALSPLGR